MASMKTGRYFAGKRFGCWEVQKKLETHIETMVILVHDFNNQKTAKAIADFLNKREEGRG